LLKSFATFSFGEATLRDTESDNQASTHNSHTDHGANHWGGEA
jgi:hypothetical protein